MTTPQTTVVNIAQFKNRKNGELGKLLAAIMYDPNILWCLQLDGPATVQAGFKGEEFGLSEADGYLLQELAQGCCTVRDLAGKFIEG